MGVGYGSEWSPLRAPLGFRDSSDKVRVCKIRVARHSSVFWTAKNLPGRKCRWRIRDPCARVEDGCKMIRVKSFAVYLIYNRMVKASIALLTAWPSSRKIYPYKTTVYLSQYFLGIQMALLNWVRFLMSTRGVPILGSNTIQVMLLTHMSCFLDQHARRSEFPFDLIVPAQPVVAKPS